MTFTPNLSINLIRPIAQTIGASLIPYVMGHLGHRTVSVQSAVLLGHTTSLLSAVAEKFFSRENKHFSYVAIPTSLYASLFVHRFFYPSAQPILDKKNFVIFTVVLGLIKYGVDHFGPAVETFALGRANKKRVPNSSSVGN